jgi:hypothetical protein
MFLRITNRVHAFFDISDETVPGGGGAVQPKFAPRNKIE